MRWVRNLEALGVGEGRIRGDWCLVRGFSAEPAGGGFGSGVVSWAERFEFLSLKECVDGDIEVSSGDATFNDALAIDEKHGGQ
jgi:hypothetical protein